MKWADNFLSQFRKQPKSTTVNSLAVPVQVQAQSTPSLEVAVVEKRGGNGRKTDEELYDAVINQPFCQID